MMVVYSRGPRRNHELTVYDGRQWVGSIIICGRTFRALDAAGGVLGEFSDQRAAVRAVISNGLEKDFCGKPADKLGQKRG
jgi:hypothetical protein